MKRLCNECLGRRQGCKPIVRNSVGKVSWVCPQCWKRLEYSPMFIKEKK